MSQNLLARNRDQPLLLPPDLRDWLAEDHLAWFVIEAVEQLDLEPFYAAYRADGHGKSNPAKAAVARKVLIAPGTCYPATSRSSRAHAALPILPRQAPPFVWPPEGPQTI